MPIYEFECEECGSRFDELVAGDAPPPPAHGAPRCRSGACSRRSPRPGASRAARGPLRRIAPRRARSRPPRAAGARPGQAGEGGAAVSATAEERRERAGRALQGGRGLHQVSPARDPHQGGLRRRQRRRRPDVRRRGPGRRRGSAGPALRRPRRPAAQPDAGGDRPLARGRLHRQRAEVAGRRGIATRSRWRSRPAGRTCSSRCA